MERSATAAARSTRTSLRDCVGELSYALGPGEEVESESGSRGVIWTFRGRKALLALRWDDHELPGTIELRRFDDESASPWKPRRQR